MNSETMKKQAALNKQYRGQIMRILARFHPTEITVNQIKIGLEEYGVPYRAEVEQYLSYLKDRNYIVIEKKGKNKERYIRLFADGTDLIEGTKVDDGVLI